MVGAGWQPYRWCPKMVRLWRLLAAHAPFNGREGEFFCKRQNAVILPRVDVGCSARLRNVVIDADVKIPEGLVVGEDPELDAERFRRTERGICLITQSMIDKLLANPGAPVLVPPLINGWRNSPFNGSAVPNLDASGRA